MRRILIAIAVLFLLPFISKAQTKFDGERRTYISGDFSLFFAPEAPSNLYSPGIYFSRPKDKRLSLTPAVGIGTYFDDNVFDNGLQLLAFSINGQVTAKLYCLEDFLYLKSTGNIALLILPNSEIPIFPLPKINLGLGFSVLKLDMGPDIGVAFLLGDIEVIQVFGLHAGYTF